MQNHPKPNPAALEKSRALTTAIRAEIADAPSGAIPFERFMELALYAPDLGYYQSGAPKFGAAGDFVTAPELSPLFSRCVARQAGQIVKETGGDILEVGAGSGVMAADVMAALQEQNALPERYRIIEKSPALRRLQRATIKARVPALLPRFHWQEEPFPDAGFRGVILANELLDAIPCDRFTVAGGAVHECRVGWDGKGFIWRRIPASPELEQAVREIEKALDRPFPDGYTSELHPARTAWVGETMGRMEAGLLLLLDYGYPRAEYYHPERNDGALICHYRHRLHDDPFFLPGCQDISVPVDFSAIAEAVTAMAAAAEGTDVRIAGFTTQRDFLFATGLLTMCEELDPTSREYLSAVQGIKTLTLPGEMGDIVKAMAITKGIGEPLLGFGGRDLRGRL
uniref:SAM-dependent methyltransferase, MidA family n=1 Tax=Candidatus Kentrum sp. DK TaxID=2126562 RepID=A0A450SSK7_9GAMM|nr:MAG: SAM-dependent methyltransferase, MidA family [Candidatus Kentron sp. DK]